MTAIKIPLYGLVLTGGKSQRMQRPKALIDYQGKPHAEFIYDLLTAYCDKVFISARLDQWQGTTLEYLPTLVDQEENLGVFAGIFTALQSYPDVNWLIMACDLVYLKPRIIEKLINNYCDDVIAICYQNSEAGFPEPLCSLYTPLAFRVFQEAKNQDIYSPVKILTMANCLLINSDNFGDLTNINTREEYQQISF